MGSIIDLEIERSRRWSVDPFNKYIVNFLILLWVFTQIIPVFAYRFSTKHSTSFYNEMK